MPGFHDKQESFGRAVEMALQQLCDFAAPVLVLGMSWPPVMILRETWAEILVSTMILPLVFILRKTRTEILVLERPAVGLDLEEDLGSELVLEDVWSLVLILRFTWAEILFLKTFGRWS